MIEIFSIEFKDRFNSIGSQNLRGCIGSFVKAKIKFYVHWELVNVDVQIDGKQLVLTNGGSWLTAGFQPGDDIKVYGPSGLSTTSIVSVDDKFLLTNYTGSFGTDGKFSVYGTSSQKAFRFAFGFPENAKQDTYFSRLDGKTTQEYILQNGAVLTDGVPYNLMNANGKKFWISGAPSEQVCTITKFTDPSGIGYGKDTYYELDHTFYNPAFIETWLDANGKLNKDLSDLYADVKNPRYAFKLSSATDNQNFRFSTDNSNLKSYELKGAVSWFGFQGSGIPTTFTIKSIIYKEDSSGDIVDSLLSNAITDVEIVINCASPSAFTNTVGQKVDTFLYEKVKKAVYTDGNNDQFTNFNVSYGSGAVGGGATTFKNISNYAVTYVSATEIKVSFKYSGNGSVNPYVLWIETQSGALTDLKATDKAPVIADENTSVIFFNTDGVVNGQTRFMDHPFQKFEDGTTDLKAWIEDGVSSITKSEVKKTNATGQTTALNKITVQIVSENSSYFFPLETIDLAIGEDSVRDFKLPSGDAKLRIALIEETSLETTTSKFYSIYYAFIVRFEEWLDQNNADAAFIPNDNKNWVNYSGLKGFDLKFCVDHVIDFSGTLRGQDTIRLKSDMAVLTYEAFGPCPVTGEIQTIDNVLTIDLQEHLSLVNDTRIKSTFKGIGLDCYNYDATTFWGIHRIYSYKAGTIADRREISTLFTPETDTPWLGLASGNKALLTKGATYNDGVTVEAILQLSQVPPGSYTITSRLGKLAPKPVDLCKCPTGSVYNEVSGNCDSNAFSDNSGTGNNGTGHGVSLVASKSGYGTAAHISGNNYVSWGNVQPAATDSFRNKYLIKFNSLADGFMFGFGHFGVNNGVMGFYLELLGGNVQVTIGGVATTSFLTSSFAFNTIDFFTLELRYHNESGNAGYALYVNDSRNAVDGNGSGANILWASNFEMIAGVPTGTQRNTVPVVAADFYIDKLEYNNVQPNSFPTTLTPATSENDFATGQRLVCLFNESSFPCSCPCPDGFTYDSVKHECVTPGDSVSTAQWYFGGNAAVDFRTLDANKEPAIIVGSAMIAGEGCTTLCNPATGDLILYTNGVDVYNDSNVAFASGLKGNSSSTQSAIVLATADPNVFTIVTLDSNSVNGGHKYGLNYSIVRSALSTPAIATIDKNIPIAGGGDSGEPFKEKLCSYPCDGGGHWIVVKTSDWNQRLTGGDLRYLAFKVNTDGTVNTTPVISIGNFPLYDPGNAIGQLKISPNGKKIAWAQEIGDFDSATGMITNFTAGPGSRYGIEFSLDSQYIFNTTDGYNVVKRLKIADGSIAFLNDPFSGSLGLGAIQNGPNGKMYFAVSGGTFIISLENPTAAPADFIWRKINLATGQHSDLGLPTYEARVISTVQVAPCPGVCVQPVFDLAGNCPAIKITMTETKGRQWIVTDDQGTSPIVIVSNASYDFGSYTDGDVVEITLTDNARPECSTKRSFTMVCSGTSTDLMYGVTLSRTSVNEGSLFSVDKLTGDYSILAQFKIASGHPDGSSADGGYSPSGDILKDGTTIYGTSRNSTDHYGLLWKVDLTESSPVIHKLIDTTSPGASTFLNPNSGLMKASNGKIYGMTRNGGANGQGMVWSYDPSSGIFAIVYSFNSSDPDPTLSLISQPVDGTAPFVEIAGFLFNVIGYNGDEVIVFKINISTGVATGIDINTDSDPHSCLGLCIGPDGNIYGAVDSPAGMYILKVIPSTGAHSVDYDTAAHTPMHGPTALSKAPDGKLWGGFTTGRYVYTTGGSPSLVIDSTGAGTKTVGKMVNDGTGLYAQVAEGTIVEVISATVIASAPANTNSITGLSA